MTASDVGVTLSCRMNGRTLSNHEKYEGGTQTADYARYCEAAGQVVALRAQATEQRKPSYDVLLLQSLRRRRLDGME